MEEYEGLCDLPSVSAVWPMWLQLNAVSGVRVSKKWSGVC